MAIICPLALHFVAAAGGADAEATAAEYHTTSGILSRGLNMSCTAAGKNMVTTAKHWPSVCTYSAYTLKLSKLVLGQPERINDSKLIEP